MQTCPGGNFFEIALLVGNTLLPKREGGNYYILTKIDLFTRFRVMGTMPGQSAQRLIEPLLPRWIIPLLAPLRILSDPGANLESAEA